MTIENWLLQAIENLKKADIPTPVLDAEVLLADVLGKDRSWLHAHTDHILQRSNLRILDSQIKRRAIHEPIAYIRGKQEFYGREFEVSPDTLTPRPETETMVELLLEQVEGRRSKVEKLNIVDVGTGSGCIIITAALEISNIKYQRSKVSYIGLDISEKALKIAKRNTKKHDIEIDFHYFDLLSEALDVRLSTFDVILANLPYVPTNFKINLAASHEPEFAIFGGKDGLDYYRHMFEQLARKSKVESRNLSSTKFVLCESLPPQHKDLEQIASESGYKLKKTQDLIQLFTKS